MFLQIILINILIITVGADPCFEDWTYFDGACYGFAEDTVTWGDAAATCMAFESRLVEIETPEENEFLKNMTATRKGHFYWIGGTDFFHEGVWRWVHSRNKISGFTDWSINSPADNGGGQDCMCLDYRYHYQWNDGDCAHEMGFICKASVLDEPLIG